MTAVVTDAPGRARPYAHGDAGPAHHRGPGALRFLPLPDTEPPVEHGAVQPTLGTSPGQGVLSLLSPELDDADDALFGPQPTPTNELPDPRQWGRRVAQLLVEVLEGLRPQVQVVRWTNDAVYRQVRRRARPLATGSRRSRTPVQRPVVGSVRVCEPADGVAEVAVVVHRRHRVHALALRLEGRDRRWVVTVLQCD